MALIKKKDKKETKVIKEEKIITEEKLEELTFDASKEEGFIEPEVQTTFNEDSIEEMNEDATLENISTDEEVLSIGHGDDREELILGSRPFGMRTSKPGSGNKYFITRGNGGWSWCIQGSPTDHQCNVMSNCVGYACGRFNEIYNAIKGTTGMKYYMLNCNAENFIERAKENGLEISNVPTLGGIMVWQKGNTLSGNDGAGHVEAVEDLYTDGSTYNSASNYGGTAFYNARRYNTNGRWGLGSGYIFRGCIVNPAVGRITGPTQPTVTPTTNLKFNIGDKVVINGPLYKSSSASSASSNVSNKVTTITRRVAGTAHPYNTTGDLGWMNESSISYYQQPSQPSSEWPKYYTVQKGDVLSKIATKYYGNGDYDHFMFIARANNLANVNMLRIGQRLTIPAYSNTVSTFNKGDRVKIVSSYAAGSNASNAPHSVAIGWNVSIINVYSGRNYPYAVGNNGVIIGFCKAEGIRKI